MFNYEMMSTANQTLPLMSQFYSTYWLVFLASFRSRRVVVVSSVLVGVTYSQGNLYVQWNIGRLSRPRKKKKTEQHTGFRYAT